MAIRPYGISVGTVLRTAERLCQGNQGQRRVTRRRKRTNAICGEAFDDSASMRSVTARVFRGGGTGFSLFGLMTSFTPCYQDILYTRARAEREGKV